MTKDELAIQASLGAVLDGVTGSMSEVTVLDSAEGETTFAGIDGDAGALERLEKAVAMLKRLSAEPDLEARSPSFE
jgi:hypothetical protein